jgi:hypothetical protein
MRWDDNIAGRPWEKGTSRGATVPLAPATGPVLA